MTYHWVQNHMPKNLEQEGPSDRIKHSSHMVTFESDCPEVIQVAYRMRSVSFSHCPREANKVAHTLTRSSYDLNSVFSGMVMLQISSSWLGSWCSSCHLSLVKCAAPSKKEATVSSALAMVILSKIAASLLKQPGGLADEEEIIMRWSLLQKAPWMCDTRSEWKYLGDDLRKVINSYLKLLKVVLGSTPFFVKLSDYSYLITLNLFDCKSYQLVFEVTKGRVWFNPFFHKYLITLNLFDCITVCMTRSLPVC